MCVCVEEFMEDHVIAFRQYCCVYTTILTVVQYHQMHQRTASRHAPASAWDVWCGACGI